MQRETETSAFGAFLKLQCAAGAAQSHCRNDQALSGAALGGKFMALQSGKRGRRRRKLQSLPNPRLLKGEEHRCGMHLNVELAGMDP